MRIIDTHLHLIYPGRFTYRWLDRFPALQRPWLAADYFAQADQLGIETALHMEAAVAPAEGIAETCFMLALHPKIGGAIAAGPPLDQVRGGRLEELARMAGVKGMRRSLEVSPGTEGWEHLVRSLELLSAFGLSFDLCVSAEQLSICRALVARCPSVQFVLDHCGCPDIAGAGLDPWRSDIAALARLPNVAVKLSGIVAYAGPDWTIQDLAPYVDHVIDCFGWARLVWGSDYPVCMLHADLGRWVEASLHLVDAASPDQKAALFSLNARRIYNLKGRTA